MPPAVELGVLTTGPLGKSKMTFNCVPHTPGQWLALGSETGQLTYAHPLVSQLKETCLFPAEDGYSNGIGQLPSDTHALSRDKRTH